MIRPTGAVWRLLTMIALAAGLLAVPAQARPAREARQVEQRATLAVAEAMAKRKRGERVWCVPFARMLSGIELKGNAKTWWTAAKGLYRRGGEPEVGAVMVFAGSRKMPMGHVAVVSELVSDRTIRVDHANWKRNQISLGMRVIDVSDKGDWSAVRVEGDPGVLGRVNPVSGFIYPGEMMASN